MNIPLVSHHQLFNRYTFDGMLELVTPLRISSGYASDTTDAPFMRGYDGTPYIPGSSLRGAIRSEIERVLVGVGEEAAGLRSCTLFEKKSCDKKICEHLNMIKENEEPKKSIDDELIKQLAEEYLCDVCRLFGSTVYASRLVIEDAVPKTAEIEAAKSHLRIRDGVGIDRDTGSAVDGAKFDYEVIEPGTGCPLFCFRMVAENVTDPDRKLIDLILNLLKQGLYVGGKRTGGLGRIKLKEKYTVTGFGDSKGLWSALVAKDGIDKIIEWEDEL